VIRSPMVEGAGHALRHFDVGLKATTQRDDPRDSAHLSANLERDGNHRPTTTSPSIVMFSAHPGFENSMPHFCKGILARVAGLD
jgi:hypothetical protein